MPFSITYKICEATDCLEIIYVEINFDDDEEKIHEKGYCIIHVSMKKNGKFFRTPKENDIKNFSYMVQNITNCMDYKHYASSQEPHLAATV